MKRLFLLLAGLFFASLTFSQKSVEKEAGKWLKAADSHLENLEFIKAIGAYNEFIKIIPNQPIARFNLAYANIQIGRGYDALPHLKYLNENYPDQSPDRDYLLALAYHQNNDFAEARDYYLKVLGAVKQIPEKKMWGNTLCNLIDMIAKGASISGSAGSGPLFKTKDAMLAHITMLAEQCVLGAKQRKSPVRAKITNMGSAINSKYPEYVPVITADESKVFFTSRRPRSGAKYDVDGLVFEDIYESSRTASGQYGVPKLLPQFNSDGHNASVAISPKGTVIFIYRDDNSGDLYSSKYIDGNWSKSQSLGKNVNSEYGELSVSITSDEKTIYFSSNRPGGFGGFDIYQSKWDEKRKTWGQAVNLGPNINTPADEDSPFIHPDNTTLYFSSKGHPGIGGYDIFITELTDEGWSKPSNLGYPINTGKDDLYFVLSEDNKQGYYSSDMPGGFGEKDLYVITMPEPENIEKTETKEVKIAARPNTLANFNVGTKTIAAKKEEVKLVILEGKTTDALTHKPIACEMIIVDNLKGVVESEQRSDSVTGFFKIVLQPGRNYGVRAEKTDYLFKSLNVFVPDSVSQTFRQDLELDRIAIGNVVRLNNIFFDYNKATLRPESVVELNRLLELLNEYPGLKIEIGGHTDSDGSDQYNFTLSDKRSESVVKYLIENGIPAERLTWKGYGESKPIATNATDEGKQLNRRTEFKILANVKTE